MIRNQTMALRPPTPRAVDRAAAGFLIALMIAGSFAMWIAVPAGCLFLTSKVTATSAEALLVGLPATIAGMIAAGMGLVWLNRLYLRVTGVVAYYQAEEDEYGPGAAPRYFRGPLETILVSSLVIALIALGVWFFVFAHNPGPGSIW